MCPEGTRFLSLQELRVTSYLGTPTEPQRPAHMWKAKCKL